MFITQANINRIVITGKRNWNNDNGNCVYKLYITDYESHHIEGTVISYNNAFSVGDIIEPQNLRFIKQGKRLALAI